MPTTKNTTKNKTLARRRTKGNATSSRTASANRVTRSMPKSQAKNAYQLLSDIRALILAEPKRYDQTQWITKRHDPGARSLGIEFPSCGTIGCVAGWVIALKAPKTPAVEIEWKAAEILGLHNWEAGDLFSGKTFDELPQTLAHARAGARHIKQFQEAHATTLKAKAV